MGGQYILSFKPNPWLLRIGGKGLACLKEQGRGKPAPLAKFGASPWSRRGGSVSGKPEAKRVRRTAGGKVDPLVEGR